MDEYMVITQKEQDVMDLLVRGKKPTEICKILHISRSNYDQRINRLNRKCPPRYVQIMNQIKPN